MEEGTRSETKERSGLTEALWKSSR